MMLFYPNSSLRKRFFFSFVSCLFVRIVSGEMRILKLYVHRRYSEMGFINDETDVEH